MTLQLVGHFVATFAEVWACAHGAHAWVPQVSFFTGPMGTHCCTVCGREESIPPTRGPAAE